MMTEANVWTVAHGDAWANNREGAARVVKVFTRKAESVAAGLGERDSYCSDPRLFGG